MVKNRLLIMQHLFFLNIEGFYFRICYSLICGLHSQYSRSFFPTSYYLEYEFAFGVFYVSSCYKEWNLVEFRTFEMKMAVYNYKTLLNNYFSYFKPKHFFFQNNKRNRGVVHLLLHLSTSSQKRATMAAQHRRLLRILLGKFILVYCINELFKKWKKLKLIKD